MFSEVIYLDSQLVLSRNFAIRVLNKYLIWVHASPMFGIPIFVTFYFSEQAEV